MVSIDILAQVRDALDSNHVDEAVAVAEQKLSDSEHEVEVVCALAAISFRQGQFAQSLKLLEAARDNPRAPADLWEVLAVLNCLVGRLTEALFCGKMATTIPTDGRLLGAFGGDLPNFAEAFAAISDRPLLRRAKAALSGADPAAARVWVEQHLAVFPAEVEALDLLATLHERQGEYDEAIGILRSVQTLGGVSATLLSRLGHLLTLAGEFDAGRTCHEMAVQRGPGSPAIQAAAVADWRYHPHAGGPRYAACVDGWRGLIQSKAPKVVRPLPPPAAGTRRCIAYLCANVQDDATRTMIGRIAARHNRENTLVIGFGSGDLGDPANLAYRNAFRRWREISQLDELTFAALARGEGVDVIIDCDGLAGASHHGLFLRNAARAQLSWLNMPYQVSLPGARGSLAGSTLACGPYLLSASESGIASALPAREAGGVTLGADITVADFNHDVVRVWSQVLQSIPDAVLALRDDGRFSRPEKTAGLVDMFGNFGVAHRIDIIRGSRAEFWNLVDVALAPFPNSPVFTYGEAFAAGIPVIVLMDGGAAELACALRATGEAADMIAGDLGDYVGKAVGWASSLDRLSEFRTQAPERVQASMPYQDEAFVACLEQYIASLLAVPAAS
jgi:tetratricopeptide (TPR) repeat protein